MNTKHSEKMVRYLFFVILTAAISACSAFPDLDERVSDQARQADYPILQPIDGLISRATASGPEKIEDVSDDVSARIARLRLRALALKGPVISARDRRRLASAAKRHAS